MGSPWTLATYLIEGGSTPLYKKIKTMTHAAPAVLQALLSHLATQIATYMCYQIESGAHCVQLFDSWGGQLPPAVRVVCCYAVEPQMPADQASARSPLHLDHLTAVALDSAASVDGSEVPSGSARHRAPDRLQPCMPCFASLPFKNLG